MRLLCFELWPDKSLGNRKLLAMTSHRKLLRPNPVRDRASLQAQVARALPQKACKARTPTKHLPCFFRISSFARTCEANAHTTVQSIESEKFRHKKHIINVE